MSAARALRGTAPDLALLGAGLVLVYAPLAPELVRDWWSSGDFSHGFFVPLVSGWIVWTRRERIGAAPIRPFPPGLALLVLAAAQYLLGVAAAEFYLQRTSAVLFLGGGVLFLFGPRVAAECAFAIVFLLFAIPPPNLVMNWIAFPLQLQASRFTELILDVAGIEAVRSGNVIHLEHVSLEVARACSGLRSLVTLSALGAIVAEGSLLPSRGGPRGTALRVLVFLGVFPVAVAVNSVRVAATAVFAANGGVVLASGWAHELVGLLMFLVSMGLLLAWRSMLRWMESWRASPPRS
ncbi:MAG: exosortase/archaeosortase family protein [Candidatus Eiseniibacteriota bacterium]